MKKMLKKLVAFGLAAVMLCGCGSGNETAESAQESENVAETEQAEVSSYPEYLNLDSARPVVNEGEDVTLRLMVMRESIANSDINENWFVKFIEDELNINLEIEEVNSSTYQERRNLVLASNDLPDIMIYMGLTASDIVTYGVEGEQLLPMSDYINEELTPNIYQMIQENEAARVENTAPDGKMYTVPILMASYPGYGNTLGTQRVFIDKKYMEAAGIEKVPETLDEFVEMLRAFKALDPAQMGVDEIWPMVSTWGNDKEFLLNAFGWVPGDSLTDPTVPAWDVEKQEIVVPCAEEKYAEYVKLLNTLYSEGLIHPDFFTIDKTAARALYAEGAVPVIADAAPYLSVPDRYEEYVSAIPVSSQWCENGVTKQGADYRLGTMFISADTEYPEVCMRFLDYLYSEEGSVYSTWGCSEGSEDSKGIIGGFYLMDNGTIGYRDVDSGKYESSFDYWVNAIELSQETPRDEGKRILYAQEMLGVEDPQYPELDLTNPDDHYRSICYEAQQGHLVQGLPSMYLAADQAATYTDLQTVIKNYVDAETAKFVVGQRSLDELDAYFEELKALGIDEYVQICKDVYQDFSPTVAE